MNQFLTEDNKRRFGDDYIRELIKALRAARKIASGKLENSLDYRLSDDANAVNLIFDAESYFENIDKGRKSGSFPPIQDIARWASIKGISSKAVYPIAQSIYKFGIRPTNILEKTENTVMNGKIFNDLEKNISTNVEDIIIEQLETLNNK